MALLTVSEGEAMTTIIRGSAEAGRQTSGHWDGVAADGGGEKEEKEKGREEGVMEGSCLPLLSQRLLVHR